MKAMVYMLAAGLFLSLSGMLVFGIMFRNAKGKVREFVDKAFEACVSVLVADGAVAMLCLAVISIAYALS